MGSDKRAERSGGKIETPNGLTGRQERWPRRIIHDGYVPRTQHIDQPKEQWRPHQPRARVRPVETPEYGRPIQFGRPSRSSVQLVAEDDGAD